MDSLKNQGGNDGQNVKIKRKGPKVKPLEAISVKRLEKPGMHAVGEVPGLLLQISAAGNKSWIYRYRLGGKRRHLGLGVYPAISLAKAREKAKKAYDEIQQGIDPVEISAKNRAKGDNVMTFDKAAALYIAGHELGWRNPKHRQQWENTLNTYASPFIGGIDVANITSAHVLKILEQPVEVNKDGEAQTQDFWTAKNETAGRVRGRIEKILDWCKGRHYRAGDNPAAWEANLKPNLPDPKMLLKTKPIQHHPAVQIDDVPAFAKGLASSEGMSAKALQLKLLTAVRSNEVRGACWAEFDLEAGLWTVPKDRTKTGETEHRVALSEQALALLQSLPRFEGCAFVFPGPSNKPLSDTALSKIMRRLDFKDKEGRVAVPHGLRSTFRDWVSERTDFDGFLAEVALHHTVGNKVEAAYRRGDAFERRKALMQAWADYCTGQSIQNDTNRD
jgi:integrase